MYTLIAYFILFAWLPLYSAEKSAPYEEIIFRTLPKSKRKSSYPCNKCSTKPFSKESSSIRHIAWKHLYCSDCCKEYNNLESIHSHMIKEHIKSNRYTPAIKKIAELIEEYNLYIKNNEKEIDKPTEESRPKKRIKPNEPHCIPQLNTDYLEINLLPRIPHVELYLNNRFLRSTPIKNDIILIRLHQILNDDPSLSMFPCYNSSLLSYCK